MIKLNDQQEIDEDNIKIEEIMKIIHKDRDWILNAIEKGMLPGTVTTNERGRRNAHIPRKAFYKYMTECHVIVDGEYIKAVAQEIANQAVEKILRELKKVTAPTVTK